MCGRKRASGSVDCSTANRGVWLVKVPRYLSDIWEQNRGRAVGNLMLNSGEKMIFRSDPSLVSSAPRPSGTLQIPKLAPATTRVGKQQIQPTPVCVGRPMKHHETPKEHNFLIKDIQNQTMAVFSEDKTGLAERATVATGNLSIEGRIVKRVECRPPDSKDYLSMKISKIKERQEPRRKIEILQKAAVKHKPTAMHAEDLVRERAKKEGVKTVRQDKDVVRDALFTAFQHHQYYRLADLQKLTNQPPNYLKDILIEIANYNTIPPHRSMWELKPEYRNYQCDQKEDEDDIEEL